MGADDCKSEKNLDRVVAELIAIIETIARGNHSDDIMGFSRQCHLEPIRRIAEAVGMMMVKVEAREYQLEKLVDNLKEVNATLKRNILQTVITMANAIGARDNYTKGHIERVAMYAHRLALRMGLEPETAEAIRIGGMLHDIGKIGFSDRLFSDADSLDSQAMSEEIRRHPEIGVDILRDLDFLGPIKDFVLYHHERVDGRGYPRGLSGNHIPLGARIIAVADCFDAVTTDRPYRPGKSREEAFAILREESGKSFDTDVVEALITEVLENGIARGHFVKTPKRSGNNPAPDD